MKKSYKLSKTTKKKSGLINVKQSDVTSLLIPTKTKPGVYEASVKVLYKGDYYTATKIFEVIPEISVKDFDVKP
ncbi:MAG: hypothetical protein AABW56_04655 [Nanoarchaeota archaeon]